MNFLSGTELGDGVMNAQAPAGCFSRVPVLSFVDAVDALLSLREVPPGRPDLVEHIPQDHDKRRVCKFVEVELNEVKKRASVSFLVNQYGLTDDDVSALICMKLEHPFPVYRWLNGWLQSSRRDTSVQRHVGPFFNLVYRALEKLPKIQQDAARSVIVNGIPALANTYNNYRTMLSPGKELSFWSWASFSTEDAVIGNPAFFRCTR